MAGFFLGGGGQPPRGDAGAGGGASEGGFFLYTGGGRGGGEYGAARGFELWQKEQHRQQFYSGAVGFSDDGAAQQPRVTRSGLVGGGMSCQDCGNQAKKDCAHLRCRTCCKSRGFPCPTHVKSTWVSAAKRRERQQQLVAAAAQADARQQRGASASSEGGAETFKRPREVSAAALATTTFGWYYNFSTISRHHFPDQFLSSTLIKHLDAGEPESFPAEVSAPAVFRCVRVSHVDEPDDAYAYHAAVSIGGHVFKGLLYDHGPAAEADPPEYLTGASISGAGDQTINTPPITTTGDRLLDPYPTPLSAFMAATQCFSNQHAP
ncbi:hypothetical protein ZIOFF_044465 [Zingiber officinale]|uniref:Uncharacterized protein n=1 Tax=Zingiber officinale TaxID=94328 RepID=A0A8J5G166_ZINOF|nr:hypothetical protein ZIOFF_044465 [Zingiber officinale]